MSRRTATTHGSTVMSFPTVFFRPSGTSAAPSKGCSSWRTGTISGRITRRHSWCGTGISIGGGPEIARIRCIECGGITCSAPLACFGRGRNSSGKSCCQREECLAGMWPSADSRLAPRFTAQAIVGGLLAHAGVTINGSRPWDIRVHDDRVYRRLLLSGSLALGESYIDGAWDCADLVELIFRLLHHRHTEGRRPWVPELNRRMAALRRAVLNLQTRARARHVVAAHYDLHPLLFEAM